MFDSVARGNVKLFRSRFLNTNPILLEYLAQVQGCDGRGDGSGLGDSGGDCS